MGPADQGAVEESCKGLWVGAPEGAGAEVAVEDGRHGGSVGVSGEDAGGL